MVGEDAPVLMTLAENYLGDLVAGVLFVFFFQAEDGIRDKLVTGVQTCALPISRGGCPRSPSATRCKAQGARDSRPDCRAECLRCGGPRDGRAAAVTA